jgi:hypothetical protein
MRVELNDIHSMDVFPPLLSTRSLCVASFIRAFLSKEGANKVYGDFWIPWTPE